MPTETDLKKFGFVDAKGNADIEVAEETRGQKVKTGYPAPVRR